MLNADKAICIERLRRRELEINKMILFLESENLFDELDIIRIRESLSSFLGRLVIQDNQSLKSRKRGKLTEADKDFYIPAIHDIIEKVNANNEATSTGDLQNNLAAAKKCIEHYIDSLEQKR